MSHTGSKILDILVRNKTGTESRLFHTHESDARAQMLMKYEINVLKLLLKCKYFCVNVYGHSILSFYCLRTKPPCNNQLSTPSKMLKCFDRLFITYHVFAV